MKKHSTKKALLLSVFSLIICFSMLIGTTFAWFTDSVTSANNIIKSGNLDIELEYWDADDEEWKDVEGASDILSGDLWEPGYVDVAYLRVKNAGSLALKYQLGVNIVSEKEGVNKDSQKFKLSDYIYFDVVEGQEPTFADREAAMANATETKLISAGYSKAGSLEAESAPVYIAMIVYMPTTVGNVANHNGETIPEIDLGINVYATQYTSEKDSFNNQYDKDAPWTGLIDTTWYNDNDAEFVLDSAEKLAGLAEIVNSATSTFAGKTVKLGADIDLNDIAWTPIGSNEGGWETKFNGTFIGTGYTISNLTVIGTKSVGLFGCVGNSAHIEGVTIDGAYVAGNDYIGAVVGSGYLAANCLKNCTVKNAEVIATPYLLGDGVTYDGGAKAGAVAGFLSNGNISGNKAINCTVSAYRDLGGIVGMVSGENRQVTVSDNSVDTIELIYFDLEGAAYDSNTPNQNMGNIVGRISNTIVGENTESNVTRTTRISYTENNIQYIELIEDEIVYLHKITEDYDSDTVIVPEGVTNISNFAFSSNSNVKTVELSSTVTDLGRGFDSSNVEKVILNEGLTTISSRAFRSTTALKEVMISSTVTEIADNAFQKSGIKEIVIPANVKTIGETAFGESLVEKVTIEGNTAIQGYAFRGCTKLKTVYLNGDDVTFIPSTLNGRDSMWFCNGESGNPNTSDIDFYVKNEVIKERVLTAMGDERNNTDVYCAKLDDEGKTLYYTDDKGNAYIYDANGLVAALEDGKNVVLCNDTKIDPAGMSNAYGTTGINVKNGQTIDGNNAILDIKGANGTWDSGINTTGGIIKNITVTGSFRGIFINHNSSHTEKVFLENVILKDVTYTISCDQGTGKDLEATNCQFYGWTSYAATLGTAKFTDCTFGEGNGYAYMRPYADTEFVGCAFEEGYEIDARGKVTFENCTIGGVAITADNLATIVTSNIANASVK